MRALGLVGIALGIISVGMWLGCASQVPHATPQQIEAALQNWPGIDAETLDRGRSVYVARCSGCHNLYPPVSIEAAKWPGIVDDMSERSGLSAGQKEDLLRYLVTVAPRG